MVKFVFAYDIMFKEWHELAIWILATKILILDTIYRSYSICMYVAMHVQIIAAG
jgi:hypothetical protein